MPVPDANSPRVRLFKNEHLERFTLISPRTFVCAWAVLLPCIAWVGWGAASLTEGAALFVGGLLVWTLFEYVLHRFVFHLDTDVPVVKSFIFLIHGNHHDHPNDPMRDMMPLSGSLPIAGTVWAVMFLLLGHSGTWMFLGFMVGYVIYDAIHFACHQWPMRGKLGAALKRHHTRHHFVDDGGNFAISAIFWDRVFGSAIRSLKR